MDGNASGGSEAFFVFVPVRATDAWARKSPLLRSVKGGRGLPYE